MRRSPAGSATLAMQLPTQLATATMLPQVLCVSTVQRMAFGELLQRHRLAAGLTQQELAERARLSVRGISDLERGVRPSPRRETAQRLAQVLSLNQEQQAELLAGRAPTVAPQVLPIAPLSNLPSQLTSFVGREGDIQVLSESLQRTRLLTLTGAGGIGKTRLALELGARIKTRFRDGVMVVELAAVTDPLLVPQTVAAAFGLREAASRDVWQVIADTLGHRDLLLVLDNCEHLLDACAELATRVLSTCPGVHVLATSRESIGIAGERTWRVESLPTPVIESEVATHIAECASAQLLVDRAAAVAPTFALDESNAYAIARICRRLDGIPLALELAAARLRALSVHELAERLETALGLVSTRGRLVPPRHQTLRATVEWSYAMLAHRERVLFRRLAVFAGSASLPAVEAICSGDGLDQDAIVDVLTQLVDKSLVTTEEHAAALRYRLLEPIREFALEQLREGDEAATLRSRHARWFLELAERGEAGLAGPDEIVRFDRLEAEHDNVRAALRWALDQSDGVLALGLASATFRFWDRRGHHVEGCRWLDQALHSAPGAPPALRAKALNSAAQLRWVWGDYKHAAELANDALVVCSAIDDKRGIAWALTSLGNAAYFQDQLEPALNFSEQSLRVAREAGDEVMLSIATACVGRTLRRTEPHPHRRARSLLMDALEIARAAGSRHGTAIGLGFLGDLAWQQSDAVGAATLWRQALQVRLELRDMRGIANSLERVALSSVSIEPERAVRLFGAAERLRERLGLELRSDERPDHARYSERAHQALGESVFRARWADGRLLPIEAAAELALRETPAVADVRQEVPAGLTPRELEVLRLIAAGHSNAQIAGQLVVSPRTIKRHVENIFSKLGVSSRSAATAFALRAGLA